MTRRIFIFNPETDYALAAGTKHYNPPAPIVRLRDTMQLIQAHIAAPGDLIVVSPEFSRASYPDRNLMELTEKRDLTLLPLSRLSNFIERTASCSWQIIPWGWNHSLRHHLLSAGIKEDMVKSVQELDSLRRLSHRRTTIPFQHMLQESLPELDIPSAYEFFSVKETMDSLHHTGEMFFKAPWSSSGRGIVRASSSIRYAERHPMSRKKLEEWLGGFIRRQGSVMGERAFDRVADFATEWIISDGKVYFLGLSLFDTSADGRYIGNRNMTTTEIDSFLRPLSPFWNHEVIEAQRLALLSLIGPEYSGPVGIDMLIATDGTLHPCVEINLRCTMGMIALDRPLPFPEA